MENNGVTIVTSTIRPEYTDEIFHNYARQKWSAKELILIINNNNISMDLFKEKAQQFDHVRIYRVDQSKNLGACLNFAVARANFNYIAKFDDDDYYSPDYIHEAMLLFTSSNADVIGKRSCYFYFPHRSVLLLRKTSVKPYGQCSRIAGATIMFHKRVFQKVSFNPRVVQGSDALFIQACLRKGYSIYNTSPYNFVAFRRPNRNSHTWKVTDTQLLSSKNASIIHTTEFKEFIDKSLDQLPFPDKIKRLAGLISQKTGSQSNWY
ncbi:glycosyltransferase [Paenibacillus solisilvae]|uniref:Glycosyltransferase n=1 Tax=Paenibacillus solisilvae TaxID=2486751 RepID=A0ABW0VXW2_9BACL